MSDNQDALLALADRIDEANERPIVIHKGAATELRRLRALNSELAGLIKQIIDSRDEHFIDQCVDGMWGWDERALAALAKVEASNGS